jgi:ubiquinone biosynthesis protein UbiJ
LPQTRRADAGAIRETPVTEWNYTGTPASQYIGPVAEDFWNAFHLYRTDNRGINGICIDGANMAGVQALEKRTATQQAKIDALSAENTALKTRLADLEARLAKLEK